MENKLQWQSVTKSLYQAILINVGCSIAVALFSVFTAFSGAKALMGGGGGFGLWSVLTLLASIGIVVAQVLFFIRLGAWRDIAEEPDKKTIGNLRTAMILSVIAVVIGLIPVIGGIIGVILNLIALILQLLAYSALKGSATMPANAKAGAGKVFTSMILNLVAVVIGIIPIVGAIIGAILKIVAFFMMLKGWSLIANSAE